MAVSENVLINVKTDDNGSIKKSQAKLSAFEESIESLRKSIDDLNATLSGSSKSFGEAEAGLKGLNQGIFASGAAIMAVKKSFDLFFDADFRKKIIDIFRIFIALAELKGFDRVASFLRIIKKELEGLDKIIKDNKLSLESFADSAESTLFKVKALSAVISVSLAGAFIYAGKKAFDFAMSMDSVKYAIYRVRNVYERLNDVLSRPEGMEIIKRELWATAAAYEAMSRIWLVRFKDSVIKGMSGAAAAVVEFSKTTRNYIGNNFVQTVYSIEQKLKGLKAIYIDGVTTLSGVVKKEFSTGFSFTKYLSNAIGEFRSEHASSLMAISVDLISFKRSFVETFSLMARAAGVSVLGIIDSLLMLSYSLLKNIGVFQAFRASSILASESATLFKRLFEAFKTGSGYMQAFTLYVSGLGAVFKNFIPLINSIVTSFVPFLSQILTVELAIRALIDTFGVLASYSKVVYSFFEPISNAVKNTISSFMGLSQSVGILVKELVLVGVKDFKSFADKIKNIFSTIYSFISSSLTGISSSVVSSFSSMFSEASKATSNGLNFVAQTVQSGFKSVADKSKAFGGSILGGIKSGLSAATREIFQNAELLVKAGSFLSHPLLLFGHTLLSSENGLYKFIGVLSVVASVLIGGFAAAFVYATGAVGGFVEKIGDTLISKMSEMEEKFVKSQQVVNAFQFVVRGFGNAVGSVTTGSLEQWNGVVAKMAENTVYSTNDIQKAIKILIAEGAALGLDFTKNVELLNRAVDIAASQGRDLTEVSIALASGLAGQSQSVLSLGLNLKETHLEHSKWLLTQNKIMDELSESEKIQLRYNEVLHQTTPILGAATAQLNTMAGSMKRLDNLYESAQAKIGTLGAATEFFVGVQNQLLSVFFMLPDAVLDVIGTLWDFLGVFLKISGVIIRYSVLISGLVVTYRTLYWITTVNATAQAALSFVMSAVGNAAGVQTVAVTSLSVAWSNFTLILRGGIVALLTTIWTGISGVTVALAKMSVALLANPLTWTIAAITASIIALIQALYDITSELSFFRDMFKKTSDEISLFGKITQYVVATVKFAWNLLFSSIKLALLGVIETITLFVMAYYSLRKTLAVTKESQDKYSQSLEYTIKTLKEADASAKKTYDSIGFSLGGVAMAAEASGEKMSELEEKSRIMALRAGKVAETLSKVSDESARISVLGTEIQKATFEISQHKKELDEVIKKYVEFGTDSKTFFEELQQKQEQLNQSIFKEKKARQDAYKAQIEALTEIKSKNEDLMVGLENMGASQFDIIDRQVEGELKKLDLKKEQLRIEGKLSKEMVKAIEVQKGLIKERGEKEKESIGKVDIISKGTIDSLKAGVGTGAAELASNISGALSSFAGAFGAVASSINGLLDFAQQLIDFIPQLLGKIAGIINSLTELPLKILEGVKNVFASVLNFVENFIPNIVTMVEGLLEAFANIMLDLPDAFQRMIEKLPGMLLKLIDRLPDFVTRFVEGMLSYLPEMAITFVEVLIEKAPYIAYKIVEFMAIKLPVAIVRGVIKAFESFFKRLGNALGGVKMPKSITNLPKDIANGANKLAKNIARESSQLFAVKNLEEAAKTAGLTSAFDESMKKAFNVWQYIIDRLMAVANYFKEVWSNFVNAFRQVINGVAQFFIMAAEMVKAIFNGVITGIKEAFTFGASAIMLAADYIGASGKKIWDGLKSSFDSAGSVFFDLGSKIVDGFKTALAALNPGNILQKMFTFDGGGRGKVEQALGIDVPFVAFAQGGMVPGSASVAGDSAVNDKILALLSPGEYVIPRSAMAIPGVSDIVKAVAAGDIDALNLFGGGIGAAFSGGASALGGAAQSIGGAISQGGKDAWTQIEQAGQDALNQLAQLDPAKLWKLVEEKVYGGIWEMITHSAPKFHTGGLVPSFADGGDVMSRLQPGEFVMQRSAVAANGLDFMNKINNGQSTASNEVYNFDINIEIEASSQALDENYVRNKLIPAIKTEFKKASSRGEYIMNDRGLR